MKIVSAEIQGDCTAGRALERGAQLQRAVQDQEATENPADRLQREGDAEEQYDARSAAEKCGNQEIGWVIRRAMWIQPPAYRDDCSGQQEADAQKRANRIQRRAKLRQQDPAKVTATSPSANHVHAIQFGEKSRPNAGRKFTRHLALCFT